MTLNLTHIPYQELNRFYAEDVIGTMHVSLKPLATDLRILRHETLEHHTENIAEELYQPQYSYVPWMVADYFDLPNDLLLKIGKAWWLTIIDVVITDQGVDRQLPDLPAIPLMLQHIRLHAERLYLQAFGDLALFWSRYHTTLAGIWNALAHETYCVDAHQQVYTFEEMRKVCKYRSDLIGTIIMIMGHVSGRTSPVEPLCQFYENLTFADQLLDDANDWKGDFGMGRYTLPIVMALEAENIPLANAGQISVDEFQLSMDRHRILVQLAEHAASLLEEAQTVLSALPRTDSPLHEVLRQRLIVAQRANKRYHAMRMMMAFLNRLQGTV